MVKLLRCLPFAALVAAASACTVHQTDVPSVTGPSEFARSFALSAAPDALTQDGVSSATVLIVARDASGAPIANAEVRLTLSPDMGTLSNRTVFTGSDGRATTTFTAPLAPTFLAGGPSSTVTVKATPVGSNFQTAVTQAAAIRLTPPPAPPVQPGAPIAVVSFAPASPKAGELVTFNASGSQASTGRRLVTYFWDFGDGTPQDEHGEDASHVYSAAGTYIMVLGVVDDIGRAASDIHVITVSN